MVSERAPAAERLRPCGRLGGAHGSARATQVGREGPRLLQALPAGARTMPGDPGGGGGFLGNRRRRLQHRRVLGDRALRGGAAPGAPGLLGAQRPEPHPGSSAVARLCGLAAGRPDGGAGAGRVPAPSEMPSRERCRLYLRSRLTSAARVPQARAPPGDLAAPPYPSQDTHPRPFPRRPRPREPWPAWGGEGKGACGSIHSFRAGHPHHWHPGTQGWGPGAACANIQTPDQYIDPGADASTLH